MCYEFLFLSLFSWCLLLSLFSALFPTALPTRLKMPSCFSFFLKDGNYIGMGSTSFLTCFGRNFFVLSYFYFASKEKGNRVCMSTIILIKISILYLLTHGPFMFFPRKVHPVYFRFKVMPIPYRRGECTGVVGVSRICLDPFPIQILSENISRKLLLAPFSILFNVDRYIHASHVSAYLTWTFFWVIFFLLFIFFYLFHLMDRSSMKNHHEKYHCFKATDLLIFICI